MGYNEQAELRLNELISIQNKFKEKFKTDNYNSWFYDSELQLLKLYNVDEDEIFFRYIPVGSFSLNSNTWMWSWFNESAIEESKAEILNVKQFGSKQNFDKLTIGTFPSDEFECWKLVAISFSIIDGIGVYKVKSDHLELYFILKNVVDKDHVDVRKIKQNKIECKNHGLGRVAFVCQHLNYETKKGFEEAFETHLGMELDDDDDFQAWCDECEKARLKSDGWNDESMEFAQIKLVCEHCYFELKTINK